MANKHINMLNIINSEGIASKPVRYFTPIKITTITKYNPSVSEPLNTVGFIV